MIQYGDVLLSNDGEIYSTPDGDLSNGDAKEQQLGAIMEATSGNFRRNPTLAANLAENLDGPVDSREIASKIQDAIFIDGWVLRDLSIETEDETTTITAIDAEKITDDTQSLI